MKTRTSALALGLCLVLAAGCETLQNPRRTQVRTAETSWGASGGEASAAPADVLDRVTARTAFPTGDEDTSTLLLEKRAPAEVRLGAPFVYELRVTNVSELDLHDVVVRDRFPAGMAVDGTDPADADDDPATATWELGSLAPGESRTITVTATSESVGDLETYSTVAYDAGLRLTWPVVEPALELTGSGPATATVCDVPEYRYVVRNPGTGIARGVELVGDLPEGMTTAAGEARVARTVGDLAGGQSREVVVPTRIAAPGEYRPALHARSTNGLETEPVACATVASAPVLELKGDAPRRAYLGRPVTYRCTVTNVGDVPAENVVVRQRLPAGAEVDAVVDGEQVDGAAQWTLGELAPGASRDVELRLVAREPGAMSAGLTAEADCLEPVRITAATEVVGIAAVVLEVVDEQDPVEVGAQVTYVVTVRNQGSADATGVAVACEVPGSATYVSSSGATAAPSASAKARAFSFEPLGSLAPGEEATWRVVVTADAGADARFRVSLTSDQLTSPVEETEATSYYE